MKISRLMTVMILVVSKGIVTHESEAWSSLLVNSLKLRVRVKILEGNYSSLLLKCLTSYGTGE